MKNLTKTFVAVIVCILCVFASAKAKTLPKTAKLVPPETIVLLEVENFSQLEKQFKQTSFYKLYKDPALAAFIEDAKSKLRKKINTRDKNDIVKNIVNADVLPQGRLAFANAIPSLANQMAHPLLPMSSVRAATCWWAGRMIKALRV